MCVWESPKTSPRCPSAATTATIHSACQRHSNAGGAMGAQPASHRLALPPVSSCRLPWLLCAFVGEPTAERSAEGDRESETERIDERPCEMPARIRVLTPARAKSESECAGSSPSSVDRLANYDSNVSVKYKHVICRYTLPRGRACVARRRAPHRFDHRGLLSVNFCASSAECGLWFTQESRTASHALPLGNNGRFTHGH